MYKIFAGRDFGLFVSFIKTGEDYVAGVRMRVAEEMSSKEVGMTKGTGTRTGDYSETETKHTELFHESDEKKALLSLLDSLDRAMIANGTAYKLMLVIDADCEPLYIYIKSNFLIVEERWMKVSDLDDLYVSVRRIDAMPFDSVSAACMFGFSTSVKKNRTIHIAGKPSSGDLLLGEYLDESIRKTGRNVSIGKETLNLGMLISGVPGTGKTFAAMHTIKEAMKSNRIPIVIISPTCEWDAFGESMGLNVLRLYESKVPFNLFKCDAEINIEKFYENLAMLLAAASDAGPYTGPLEKCLLAAFRRIYSKTRAPDPVKAYDEIEEAVIEQHAKRSNVGIKYTKHGENIRASLENLRQMLSRPEFAYEDGVDFKKVVEGGVVFDLSLVSNKLKLFFYALLLNQVYSLADSFDEKGDGALRLLICLEESQLVFAKEEKSAATADLTQRIQNFRKKGVGLMLVTHSASDIDPRIRRLCQTKLYFRQSADVAKYAAEDLLFDEKDKDILVERLKTLEQGECALNCIEGPAGKRSPASSLFISIPQLTIDELRNKKEMFEACAVPEKMTMKIKITDKEGKTKEGEKVQVFFLGEKVYEGRTDSLGILSVENTIKNKEYRIAVIGERRKDTKIFKAEGGNENTIRI
jgi:hypothetical protein